MKHIRRNPSSHLLLPHTSKKLETSSFYSLNLKRKHTHLALTPLSSSCTHFQRQLRHNRPKVRLRGPLVTTNLPPLSSFFSTAAAAASASTAGFYRIIQVDMCCCYRLLTKCENNAAFHQENTNSSCFRGTREKHTERLSMKLFKNTYKRFTKSNNQISHNPQ